MCWIGKRTDKRIAENDIKAYKVVLLYTLDENVLMSPRKFFQYTEGKTYTASIFEFRSPTVDRIKIDYGLHCYSNKCKFIRYDESLSKDIDCTIHVELEREQSMLDSGAVHYYSKDAYYNPVVVECTIPKGTKYYRNYAGEIVTEKLRINKVTQL